MSKVPLSISLLDWSFFNFGLSTRSSMGIDNTPLGLLWEEICESTLAAIGQLATTGRCTFPKLDRIRERIRDDALGENE
jgi:hypothetical protein